MCNVCTLLWFYWLLRSPDSTPDSNHLFSTAHSRNKLFCDVFINSVVTEWRSECWSMQTDYTLNMPPPQPILQSFAIHPWSLLSINPPLPFLSSVSTPHASLPFLLLIQPSLLDQPLTLFLILPLSFPLSLSLPPFFMHPLISSRSSPFHYLR